MKPGDTVLVDTNVIIEGHVSHSWAALTGAYQVETVEKCVVEAMTGRHDWHQTKPTDAELRGSFHAIYEPRPAEMAQVLLAGGALLDDGEQHLWAHALSRKDAWILCGPDRASMRFGYEQKQRERLVSLGGLLNAIKFKAKEPLRNHFEQPWLDEVIRKLILGLI
jgi:hypothetical protein